MCNIFFLTLMVLFLPQPIPPASPQHFKLPATGQVVAASPLQGVRTTAMICGVAPIGKGEPGIAVKTAIGINLEADDCVDISGRKDTSS